MNANSVGDAITRTLITLCLAVSPVAIVHAGGLLDLDRLVKRAEPLGAEVALTTLEREAIHRMAKADLAVRFARPISDLADISGCAAGKWGPCVRKERARRELMRRRLHELQATGYPDVVSLPDQDSICQ